MTGQPRMSRGEGLKEGLLWHDAGDGDLASKIAAAAQRYGEKFGREPDTCHVHLGLLPGQAAAPVRVGQIELLGDPSMLPDHFWVGVAGHVAYPRDG